MHKYQVGMEEAGVLLGSKRGQYLVCEMDLVSVDFEGEILGWEILVFNINRDRQLSSPCGQMFIQASIAAPLQSLKCP